jgi:rapamycin-insensitive companion of mTOR
MVYCAGFGNCDHAFPRLLEKFKVFTAFYHLSELRSREDLIKGIVENLDYTM